MLKSPGDRMPPLSARAIAVAGAQLDPLTSAITECDFESL
ncbi:hypothetical protein ACPOL_5079 [Acidisarcina polymorpha]|uniref:Uncharacterized protein n=1 Tax=Acidisarcina polymorpha TaxID=2211140 RepID=A0A2Z5G6Q9_9BACT|nr:hypothetical protein ACPOL_5079 [Acidisarcina polymorpha]